MGNLQTLKPWMALALLLALTACAPEKKEFDPGKKHHKVVLPQEARKLGWPGRDERYDFRNGEVFLFRKNKDLCIRILKDTKITELTFYNPTAENVPATRLYVDTKKPKNNSIEYFSFPQAQLKAFFKDLAEAYDRGDYRAANTVYGEYLRD